MRVREATREEADEVVDELLLPAYRENEALDPSYNELDEEYLETADCSRWLDHEDRTMFVAEVDGDLVGQVSGLISESPPLYARGPEVHVDGLYVVEEHRRSGIATALLDRMGAWAEERGCEHLGVTVHVANGPARELYERAFERTYLGYRRPVE